MQVGRVLGALDSIGAETTTVVVVCADHVRECCPSRTSKPVAINTYIWARSAAPPIS
jgi:hypothetical protein